MKNEPLERLLQAIDQFGSGASMTHPRLTRAISEARKELECKESDSAACYAFLDLEALYGDLIRYGNYTAETARKEFPTITEQLVMRAMYASDECPYCCVRWITHGNKHADSCRISHLPYNSQAR